MRTAPPDQPLPRLSQRLHVATSWHHAPALQWHGIVAMAVVAGVLGACSPAPVTWDEVTYPAVAPALSTEPVTATLPPDPCPGSVRMSPMGSDLFATWWRVRPDSSAVLMAARSTDGGRSWPTVVAADTTDHALWGCARPAPAIYADARTAYVHIAYFMRASEGAGVFFTHTMDGRRLGTNEGVFHSPVAIVYGERPSAASVTAIGDTVAVAYEDPNGDRPQVGLALSRTMGHIFEIRVPVSSASLASSNPRVVLAPGHTVIVTWTEHDAGESAGRTAVRRGEWH